MATIKTSNRQRRTKQKTQQDFKISSLLYKLQFWFDQWTGKRARQELAQARAAKAQAEHSLHQAQRQISRLQQQIQGFRERSIAGFLTPDPIALERITAQLNFLPLDLNKIQITGILENCFHPLEEAIASFLQAEFAKLPKRQLRRLLKIALQDLHSLKTGTDPDYNLNLTPHVYFLRYFADNVYCAYVAWFLIYQEGQLPKNPKILDIAAGPGTALYGLSLLMQSLGDPRQSHITYHSLEKQSSFQEQGLKLWQHFAEQESPHLFTQFQCVDFIQDSDCCNNIPESFFDFVVVSHCFFFETKTRESSYSFYRHVFETKITQGGQVLLIVQGNKLFKAYGQRLSEDRRAEQEVIRAFATDLGLRITFFQYLTSTGNRGLMENFGAFAKSHCARQQILGPLAQHYLKLNYSSHYTLDDYVILCEPLRAPSQASSGLHIAPSVPEAQPS